MKPVRSIKNQFLGINPHLHSYLQDTGAWVQFHAPYLVNLRNSLRRELLSMNYTAELSSSLQIRRVDDDGQPINPESDVTIYDLDPLRSIASQISQRSQLLTTSGELILQITPEIIRQGRLSEKPYQAIGIYEWIPGDKDRGDPVVWIELLSPTNKPPHADSKQYIEKRRKIIESGVVFVELDYLHETAPTIGGVSLYRGGKWNPWLDDAHPYRIIVIDPRPQLDKGTVRVREFDVDQAIPVMEIPLNGDDVLNFDFGSPYRKTYEEALYGLDVVDYAKFPVSFERYSPDDQTHIACRMLDILQAVHKGIDLETTEISPCNQVNTLSGIIAAIADLKRNA